MILKQDLLDAIRETEKKPNDYHKCEKLATYYTLLSHLYPECDKKPQPMMSGGFSFDDSPDRAVVANYGESDFLKAMSGKDEREAWELMDELMQTLAILNPRLRDSVMRKLNN